MALALDWAIACAVCSSARRLERWDSLAPSRASITRVRVRNASQHAKIAAPTVPTAKTLLMIRPVHSKASCGLLRLRGFVSLRGWGVRGSLPAGATAGGLSAALLLPLP